MGKAAVTRIARSVMMRGMEKKQRTFSLMTAKLLQGGGLSLTGTLQSEYGAIISNLPALLTVTQGTNAQTRIGNKLNNAACVVSGFICSTAFSVANNPNTSPFEVVMLVYRKKDDYANNDPNELKDSKTNTFVPISGTISNDMLPFAPGYTIYKVRRWRLKPQPVSIVKQVDDVADKTPVAEMLNPETGSSLNPMMVRFRQRMPLPKTVVYDENSPYGIMNSSFAIGFYYLNCNGVATSYGQSRAEITMDAHLTWTD